MRHATQSSRSWLPQATAITTGNSAPWYPVLDAEIDGIHVRSGLDRHVANLDRWYGGQANIDACLRMLGGDQERPHFGGEVHAERMFCEFSTSGNPGGQ